MEVGHTNSVILSHADGYKLLISRILRIGSRGLTVKYILNCHPPVPLYLPRRFLSDPVEF